MAVVALEVHVPAPREALPCDFIERECDEVLHRLADVARLARPRAVPVAVLVVVVRTVAVGSCEEMVVLRVLGGLEADFDRVARAHLSGLVSRLLVVHELRVLAVVAIGDIEVFVVAREPSARLAVGLLEVVEERRRLGSVANPLFKLDRGLDAGGELLEDCRLRAGALLLVDETRNVHVAWTVLGRFEVVACELELEIVNPDVGILAARLGEFNRDWTEEPAAGKIGRRDLIASPFLCQLEHLCRGAADFHAHLCAWNRSFHPRREDALKTLVRRRVVRIEAKVLRSRAEMEAKRLLARMLLGRVADESREEVLLVHLCRALGPVEAGAVAEVRRHAVA